MDRHGLGGEIVEYVDGGVRVGRDDIETSLNRQLKPPGPSNPGQLGWRLSPVAPHHIARREEVELPARLQGLVELQFAGPAVEERWSVTAIDVGDQYTRSGDLISPVISSSLRGLPQTAKLCASVAASRVCSLPLARTSERCQRAPSERRAHRRQFVE